MSFFKNIKWSPLNYIEASVLAKEAGMEMLSRLDWMTLKPNVIVDMGCGTGEMSPLLQARYPHANVISLDVSESMMAYARHQAALSACVCADAGQLPFPQQSVDLIFANFLLPWCEDISVLLREWRRVLRPDGLLMLTALGPDTLREWRDIVSIESIPFCIDMHDIGDLLLQEGFADPVLDVNHYTMTYRNQEKFIAELIDSGMLALSFDALNKEQILPSNEGIWPVTHEIIYAHAFAPLAMKQAASSDGTVKIPLSQLKQQLIAKS